MNIYYILLIIFIFLILISITIYFTVRISKNRHHYRICKSIIDNFTSIRKVVSYDSYDNIVDDKTIKGDKKTFKYNFLNKNATYDFLCKIGSSSKPINYYFKVIDNSSLDEIIIKSNNLIIKRTKHNHIKRYSLIDFIKFITPNKKDVKVIIIYPSSSICAQLLENGQLHIVDYFHRINGIHIINYDKIMNNSELLEEIR